MGMTLIVIRGYVIFNKNFFLRLDPFSRLLLTLILCYNKKKKIPNKL